MDAAIANSGLRERLRKQTRGLHDLLDSRFDGAFAADLERYTGFLLMNARVLPVLEARLAQDEEYRTLDDWKERFRTRALERDLTGLGVEMPETTPFPHQPMRGAGAGIAYVLEGSRVGARAIAKRLSESGLDFVPTAFLRHGREQRYWQDFLDWLARREGDEDYARGAVASAAAAFQFYLEASEV
ncbi:biliverdin-producing heme oxygenase [Tepidamorphus sp. 3E244]|uniref:biliverdin-producing heme oxygenase n=1 Tax=Tepidamorphus sp. 3E244 TaxID=3385498 RepID=UPI0038FCDA21